MLGTRGVPARYGGFEYAVEEIGSRLVERGYAVTVYCRNAGQSMAEYRGMHLVNLPAVRHRALETLSHSGASALHAVLRDRPDVALVFNPANAPFLQPLRWAGIPTAVNLDGLESQRAKWAGAGARYLRWAEQAALSGADAVVADSRVLQSMVRERTGVEAVYLTYGAPTVLGGTDRLESAGLVPDGYHLVVARFEPENQVREAVAAHCASGAQLPLVVVGSAPYAAEYSAQVRAAAGEHTLLLGSVWDQRLLDQLYAGARSYVHGHTVGGTNPSLLWAMAAGAPVIADGNAFNREVAGDSGRYFTGPDELAVLMLEAEADPQAARDRGALGRARVEELYRWSDVVDGYAALVDRLAG